MQKLETRFTMYGHNFKQLERKENFALFERTLPDGKVIAYEVIRIRIKGEKEVFGKKRPATEAYPTTSQFGDGAWSLIYTPIEKALVRLQYEYDRYVQRQKDMK
jgi:hypothetical protein